MPNKIILISLLFISGLLTVILVINNQPIKVTSVEQMAQDTTLKAQTQHPVKNSDNKLRNDSKVKNPNQSSKPVYQDDANTDDNFSTYTPLIDELQHKKYSADPIEELFSIAAEFQHCKNSTRILESHTDEIKNHQELLASLTEECEQLANNYPNIEQMQGLSKIQDLINENHIDSKLTSLFKRILAREKSPELGREIIETFIKSKNAQLIYSLTSLPSSLSLDYLIQQVQTSIGTENTDYAELITQQALVVYSCQFNQGISCKPTSGFMLKQCTDNPSLCGKGAMHWYNKFISPGHKADIEQSINIFSIY